MNFDTVKYSHNKAKPLRKRSSLYDNIPESSRWCDCCMKLVSEWTFEGSLKSRIYHNQ